MNIRLLFEEELAKRGLRFSIDSKSGRHALEIRGVRTFVSLENLQRDISDDGDIGRISRFVDSIVASSAGINNPNLLEQLYWCIEPNDYVEKADFREALSDQADRVLVHLSADNRLITWVNPQMLQTIGLSESDARVRAFANLARMLKQATIEMMDIDGVKLGFINTTIPFKTALILAPNLREVIGSVLGWPLMAVIPNRNFLYLWAARHGNFANRVGSTVVREYSQSAYPISTEVFEITDQQIHAIGEFPRKTGENV